MIAWIPRNLLLLSLPVPLKHKTQKHRPLIPSSVIFSGSLQAWNTPLLEICAVWVLLSIMTGYFPGKLSA